MVFEDYRIHEKFGIDEVYFHEGFSNHLLEKLHQRAVLVLDGEDPIVQKYASRDGVFIFYKLVPKHSLVSRFLQCVDQDKNKEAYIKSNTLLNEEELFAAIKLKKFILITRQALVKQVYSPA